MRRWRSAGGRDRHHRPLSANAKRQSVSVDCTVPASRRTDAWRASYVSHPAANVRRPMCTLYPWHQARRSAGGSIDDRRVIMLLCVYVPGHIFCVHTWIPGLSHSEHRAFSQ
ncbi:hypothetical protein BD310DRAFT_917548 [Dichomitus squalens]|uniref:Uncharacterized protein n=1 Tax=Dichomitus squalens TaxID=114155 RepID=A0A4Q9Q7K2_9APHY|nr:hypothetical protein BD310DRAFT_917548 [Dichomitus squalens]